MAQTKIAAVTDEKLINLFDEVDEADNKPGTVVRLTLGIERSTDPDQLLAVAYAAGVLAASAEDEDSNQSKACRVIAQAVRHRLNKLGFKDEAKQLED